MITGVHTILYSSDAGATRAFFRDVLEFGSVDVGEGWLIFGLPPGELAAHPAEGSDIGRHELFLMCDDVQAAMSKLKQRGVEFTSEVRDAGWGLITSLRVPGVGNVWIYQPKHARPEPHRVAGQKAKGKKARSRHSGVKREGGKVTKRSVKAGGKAKSGKNARRKK